MTSSKLPLIFRIGSLFSSTPNTNSGAISAICCLSSLNLAVSSAVFSVLLAKLLYSSDIPSKLFFFCCKELISLVVVPITSFCFSASFSYLWIVSSIHCIPLDIAKVAKPIIAPFNKLVAIFNVPIPIEVLDKLCLNAPKPVPALVITFAPLAPATFAAITACLNDCSIVVVALIGVPIIFKGFISLATFLVPFVIPIPENNVFKVIKLPINAGVVNFNLSNAFITLFIPLDTDIKPSKNPYVVFELNTVWNISAHIVFNSFKRPTRLSKYCLFSASAEPNCNPCENSLLISLKVS